MRQLHYPIAVFILAVLVSISLVGYGMIAIPRPGWRETGHPSPERRCP
ncbi:MAG: hypothetical protein ACLPSM_00200 [Acidimicrobiales bacterium]